MIKTALKEAKIGIVNSERSIGFNSRKLLSKNSIDSIVLEQDYKGDMIFLEDSYLSESAFNKLWKLCFNHVKIREYKQVIIIITF